MSKTTPQVAIIDYQMSNLFSVQHACEFVGLHSTITSDPKVVATADAVILPGVGAFRDAMNYLNKLGLSDAIHASIKQGKPFLGVCLGLQLLFTESDEFGLNKGLNVIPGRVTKFLAQDPQGQTIKIPQIGWNTISPVAGSAHPWSETALREVSPGSFMYFVHSFFVTPTQPNDWLSETTYEGMQYCSAIARDNVLAVQFHPEKSGPEGMKIYRSWAKIFTQ